MAIESCPQHTHCLPQENFAMQELCGKGSSRSDFLCCMVKTRQWQDAQVARKTDLDHRPWKAYYRVLGQLDLQRDTSEKARGFQEKFCEWLKGCLDFEALGVHCGDVWKVLKNISEQMLNVHNIESGLKTWQASFLEGPLQDQWDHTQPDIADAAAALQHVDNFPDVGGYTAPPLADAARQPLPLEQMGQDDLQLDDLQLPDIVLASLHNSLPDSPVGLQQHARQMLAFDNQPNADSDAALHELAQGHLEVRQAEGNIALGQLDGTNDKVPAHQALVCFMLATTSFHIVL